MVQVNEMLCKILAHNLCCVIQSMDVLGIEVDFRSGRLYLRVWHKKHERNATRAVGLNELLGGVLESKCYLV